MFKNSIKKSTIALVAVAILGTAATPVLASSKSFSFASLHDGITNLFAKAETGEKNSNENFAIVGGNLFSNSSAKAARTAYNNAIQQADKTYNSASKTARTNLNASLKSAGNDATKRLAAYKTYMSDLLAAYKQRSTDKETAIQNYINALSNVQVNQAPTANSQSITANENSAKTVTLTGSNPENSSLTFTVVTNPAHGTISGTVPNLTYTPNNNYSGSDSFTFKVNDGTQDSATATISISVASINQAPTAISQSITATKNISRVITLTGSDPENSTLSFSILSNPAHGTLSGTVPNLTYLPNTDFTGSDSFTFKANDGSLDSAAATISITVNP